jgi:hypothetical protein
MTAFFSASYLSTDLSVVKYQQVYKLSAENATNSSDTKVKSTIKELRNHSDKLRGKF